VIQPRRRHCLDDNADLATDFFNSLGRFCDGVLF
jgi:hypothetical protein